MRLFRRKQTHQEQPAPVAVTRSATPDQMLAAFAAEQPDNGEAAARPNGEAAGLILQTASQPPRWLRAAGYAWYGASWAAVLAAAIGVIAILALIAVPSFMGWKGLIVLSGSMEPELKVGGLAFMQPLSRSDLDQMHAGDILTYRTQARNLISHRILEVNQTPAGPSFVTKGDANDSPDAAAVDASMVVGKVRFDVPYMGHAVEKLRDRTTYYIFIGIPAAMLIAGELWNIAKEVRKARRQHKGSGIDAEGAYS